MGRKRVYGLTLILMVVCSIGSGLSFGDSPKGVIATLCFYRFWLGFGIGSDYPLSATIMSEYANKKTRGAFIAAVFAMQGFGILGGGIVALIVASAFDHKYKAPAYQVDPIGSTVPQADYAWRIILMFGALPAALAYYWRMKMPETARYTALVGRSAKQAAADMSKVLHVDMEAEQEKVDRLAREKNSYGLFSKEFARHHGLPLIGTASTWFLLEIAFYSQTLFQKDIFTAIGWIPPAKTLNAIHEVYKIAKAQTLIAICSTFCGPLLVHLLFANFGPNVTTFVVPAEIFLARLRSTCHGISVVAGKAGAMVGAFGFLYAAQNKDPAKTDAVYPPGIGMKNSLIMLGVINFVGMLLTFLVPESKGKSLEDLTGKNEEETAEAEAQHA
ncbi:hypothetical protein NL676_021235 [Syzygium grande]|nr:hypothetical protein NL676_021235 [Syzygium grande]